MKTKSLIILVLIALSSCTSNEEQKKASLPVKQKENRPIQFTKIGYYKATNNSRIFIFIFNTDPFFNPDSIPDNLIKDIRNHASSLWYESGRVTVSFYYALNLTANVHNLAGFDNFYDAKEYAFDCGPDIVAWHMPGGQINVFTPPY